MTEPGNEYAGRELEGLEQAHNYYEWILAEFRDALRGRVLEIGAGAGTFTEYLLTTDLGELICLEPADNLIPRLRARTQGLRVRIRHEPFPCVWDEGPVDAIVCVNVLEHIDDDMAALRVMHEILKPDGILCLFVPALQWIYGTLDMAFEHYRRYYKRDLCHRVEAAGFTVQRAKYVNGLGICTWLLMGKLLRWRTWGSSPVGMYDKCVVPMLHGMESRLPPPIGQSLLVIAEKRVSG